MIDFLMSGGLAASVCMVCLVKIFTLPKEPIKKPPPKRNAKAKRNGKPKKATVKKNLQVEKPKKTKKAKWAKAPQLSEYEQREFDRYTFDTTKVRRH